MREPKTAAGSPLRSGSRRAPRSFGRILAVAVNQRYKIISALERVVIPEFLITPVSLILRIEKNHQRKRKVGISGDRVALLKRSVGGGVVDNQYVDFVSIPKFDGNPEDYFANGLFSIVGNNENKNSWLSGIAHRAI